MPEPDIRSGAYMCEQPPPGFRGLDPSKDVTIRRRHLPHWRQEGATYFVTFRLADSLPQDRIGQLLEARTAWIDAHPEPTDADWDEYHRRAFIRLEEWLHEGHGTCSLRDELNANLVADAMRYFDGSRCLLGCSVVMANHVHGVVCPSSGYELETLIQSWKRFSGARINRRMGRTGDSLWQDESFDRIVRDVAHLRRCVRYAEMNAAGAGRPDRFWIRDEWRGWYYGPSGRETGSNSVSAGRRPQSELRPTS
jgi:hypothetical protein